MADESKPTEVAEAAAEVVESSTTTTTSTTKVTRRVRRTSRSRSPSPSRGRARSRSPSRRKSLNRSPSPHRYNTRNNSEVQDEKTETATSSGCSVSKYVGCISSTLTHVCKKYKSLVVDIVKCVFYITLTYIGYTMCTFEKCDIRYPTVPSLSGLYDETAFLQCLAGFAFYVLLYTLIPGEEVTGVPTDRGTLSYRCNGSVVLFLILALNAGIFKYNPVLLDTSSNELQLLFGTLLVILLAAFCIQWQFACFGTIYNVVGGIVAAYLIEQRFNLTGFPPIYFSSTLMIFGMCLNTYALFKSVLVKGSSMSCNTTCASRGLLILAVTWSLFHSHFDRPVPECFYNTAALVGIFATTVVLAYFIFKHRECAKASAALMLVTGIVAGVLVHKKYLTIPEKVPYLSLWYCFNIGSGLDALFVIALGGFKTNFFGFKPVNFVRSVLEGKHDPRYTIPFFNSKLDVKFVCIRLGYLCPVMFCIIKGAERYSAGTMPCIGILSTVLAMTLTYAHVKLVVLEKAAISSAEIVEKRCSVPFMIWTLMAQPTLIYLPLRYVLSAPADSLTTACTYHSVLMVGTFIFGLVLHTFSTLQGHYLLIGETHWVTKCLTTLAANGGEQIPISGLWRFIRYPFITGDIMAVASIALFCGCDVPLLYLPTVILVIRSLLTIRTYNKISPSFYGVRAWNSYQQMVKYNIIPGIY